MDERTLDNFLVPQVAYLRDIQCSRMAFHTQCTERNGSALVDGFKQLMGRLHQPFDGSILDKAKHRRSQGERHTGRRLGNTVATKVTPEVRERLARCNLVDASDRYYVRSVMYWEDDELFRAACRGERFFP